MTPTLCYSGHTLCSNQNNNLRSETFFLSFSNHKPWSRMTEMCRCKLTYFHPCRHTTPFPEYCYKPQYAWSESDGYHIRVPCAGWNRQRLADLREGPEWKCTRFCEACHTKLMTRLKNLEETGDRLDERRDMRFATMAQQWDVKVESCDDTLARSAGA